MHYDGRGGRIQSLPGFVGCLRFLPLRQSLTDSRFRSLVAENVCVLNLCEPLFSYGINSKWQSSQ
jgi:hypothetical protein